MVGGEEGAGWEDGGAGEGREVDATGVGGGKVDAANDAVQRSSVQRAAVGGGGRDAGLPGALPPQKLPESPERGHVGGEGSVMEAIPSKTAAVWVEDLLKDGWAGKEKEHQHLRNLQPTIVHFTRNVNKNRDPMTPLFDKNRVLLHVSNSEKDKRNKKGPADKVKSEGGEDYIHASWINAGTLQPYILTQLPLQNTIPDFWHMVWEEGVNVIVCLQDLATEPEEVRYFPLKINDATQAKAKNWSFTVENRTRDGGSADAHPDWTVRQLHLTKERCKGPTPRPRRLTHISYLRWPESEWDLPPDSLLDLVDLMGRVNVSYGPQTPEGPRSPILVHCLNGATRSGTLAALAIAAETLDASGLIVVQDVVKDLRLHRYGAVPNMHHYLHVNRRLLDHALKEGVIKKDDPLVPIVTKALLKPD